MTQMVNFYERIYPEIGFSASRSSGAGGQHVNKVNTRVELRFNIRDSRLLTDDERALLLEKLSGRLTKDGELIVVSEKTRSQFSNREDGLSRLVMILEGAFRPTRKRIASKPGLSAKLRRLDSKKLHSLKKKNRHKPDW